MTIALSVAVGGFRVSEQLSLEKFDGRVAFRRVLSGWVNSSHPVSYKITLSMPAVTVK